MVMSSTHGINDLGSKSLCKEDQTLKDISDFSVLNINATHLPVVLHFGLCLPK